MITKGNPMCLSSLSSGLTRTLLQHQLLRQQHPRYSPKRSLPRPAQPPRTRSILLLQLLQKTRPDSRISLYPYLNTFFPSHYLHLCRCQLGQTHPTLITFLIDIIRPDLIMWTCAGSLNTHYSSFLAISVKSLLKCSIASPSSSSTCTRYTTQRCRRPLMRT